MAISNMFQTFCRLPYTSKATKERLEKHGNQKLGQGGYLKLKEQIVSTR